MFSRFDWQSEDESDWNNAAGETPPIPIQLRKGLKPRFLLVFLLIALPSSILVLGGLNRKIANTNAQVTADVLAAHNLVKQAVDTGDVDLFDTMISAADENWHRLQVELFRHQLVVDRNSLGLAAPSDGAADLGKYRIQVKFSPDLDYAEVIDLQPYFSQVVSSEPIPINLENSSFYERNGDRWFISPVRDPDVYWGDWLREQFDLLSVTYPARDKESVSRLGRDLAELVHHVCSHERINCPVDLTLRLLFARDPGSLMRLNDNYRTLGLSSGYEAYRIVLPAPSLIGRPTDESSYQALFRGYGSWIAAILVNRYGLERGEDVDRSMISYLKSWELIPPPMPKLPTPQAVRYTPPPPISFPVQEVLMACNGYTPAQSFLYDPEADEWRLLQDFKNIPAIAKIITASNQSTRFPPDSQGFLIRNRQKVLGPSAWQAYLWLEGIGSLPIHGRESQILLADPIQMPSDPANEYLVFYRFSNDKETSLDKPLVLNVNRCLDGRCEFHETEGIPIWSPNHQHTLISAVDEKGRMNLYHGDEFGNRLSIVGAGYAPTWLDTKRYAYIRIVPTEEGGSLGRGETELIVAHLDEKADSDEGTVLLHASSLMAAVPINHITKELAITMAINHPQRPNQWFLSATSVNGAGVNTEYVFMFDSENGSIKLLTYLTGKRFSYGLTLTENGRYLSLLAFDEGDLPGGEWELHVINLESSESDQLEKVFKTSSGYYNWSKDGEWLLLAEDGLFRLIAPGVNYERQIQHNLGCNVVGWTENAGR